MTEMFRENELFIGDHNWHEHVDAVVDGEKKARGCIPRDWQKMPYCGTPRAVSFDMPIIPRNERIERAKEMAANKSRLSDIRRSAGPNGGIIPSLDQNGKGYCWAHSSTMAVMLARAVANMPYVHLSAYMVACIIKNYVDQGGWGCQSMDFIIEHGVPSTDFWPARSMSPSNDTTEMRANAKLHIPFETWMDIDKPEYNRNLSIDQEHTAYCNRQPCVKDENWWGHSICGMDLVVVSEDKGLLATDFDSLDLDNEKELAVYAAAFGVRILNSWGDSYGNQGEAVLTGSKAISDGGCSVGAVQPSLD